MNATSPSSFIIYIASSVPNRFLPNFKWENKIGEYFIGEYHTRTEEIDGKTFKMPYREIRRHQKDEEWKLRAWIKENVHWDWLFPDVSFSKMIYINAPTIGYDLIK